MHPGIHAEVAYEQFWRYLRTTRNSATSYEYDVAYMFYRAPDVPRSRLSPLSLSAHFELNVSYLPGCFA